MIRLFETIDIRRLKPNQFSGPIELVDSIINDPEFYKHTLVGHDDSVRALIFFKRYWGNCFAAFLLISDNITLRDSINLKKFIYQVTADLIPFS